MTLAKEEVIRDHEDSARDIEALAKIVAALEVFISCPTESRGSLRSDLFKYRALLSEAKRIHVNIESKLAELTQH